MTNDDNLPRHADGRKATWFELFFDLVFVVAVAQLSSAYAHHYDLTGALVFALAFLAMWWCWLGHTFHATRFDDDSGRRRGMGFLQIVAVALIGYGESDPLGDRAWAFGGGIAAFKMLLVLAYGVSIAGRGGDSRWGWTWSRPGWWRGTLRRCRRIPSTCLSALAYSPSFCWVKAWRR